MTTRPVQPDDGFIRRSTDDDLEEILRWLSEQEQDPSVPTLACNRGITERCHHDGELLAYIDKATNKAVAYQLGGLIQPGILEVRADMRGKGIGHKMVDYCIGQAKADGHHVLRIHCKPSSSVPFWTRMGFALDGSPDNHAYRFLGEKFELPNDGLRTEVRLELYMEEKKWKKDLGPEEVITTTGVNLTDGAIQLPERIFLPSDGRRSSGDYVLGIFVDNSEMFLDKGKYLNERFYSDTPILGVQKDNGCFVIDRLKFLTG